jgi:hypothetical protein
MHLFDGRPIDRWLQVIDRRQSRTAAAAADGHTRGRPLADLRTRSRRHNHLDAAGWPVFWPRLSFFDFGLSGFVRYAAPLAAVPRIADLRSVGGSALAGCWHRRSLVIIEFGGR